MLNKIEIVDIRINEGISKEKKQPYRIVEAQCILYPDKPGDPKVVGSLAIPKDFPDPKPGEYLAEFRMAAGFDGKLVGRLARLTPAQQGPQAATPQASAKV